MDGLRKTLTEQAQAFLGNQAWTTDVVLKMGVDLSKTVNNEKSLSGKEKTELVCQTILGLLDDVMKVEKEHEGESTETKNTTALVEDCKQTVKTLLPVTLHLVISAARGEFSDLQKKKIEEEAKAVVASVEKALTDALPDALDPVAHMAAKAATAAVPQVVEVAEKFVCTSCLPFLLKKASPQSAIPVPPGSAQTLPKESVPQAKPQEIQLQIRQPGVSDPKPENASA